MNINELISKQINIKDWQAKSTIALLEEGGTVPFISRYRKERTGGLDEVQILDVKTLLAKLKELEKRKKTIVKSIQEQGKLTDDLQSRIRSCYDSNALEDIYLPFKQKRKTKASVARENGLEPMAKILMSQSESNVEGRAKQFTSTAVKSVELVLEGARYIVAEWMSENAAFRNKMRRHFERNSEVNTKVIKGKEEEGEKFKDYFKYTEPLYKCRSHRMLALRRGEDLGILKLSISPEERPTIEMTEEFFVKGHSASSFG